MFNMNAIESGAYPLQMFFFIKTHFDIFFRIAKKKKSHKMETLLETICQGEIVSTWNLDSIRIKFLFVGTLKENQSNFNLIA